MNKTFAYTFLLALILFITGYLFMNSPGSRKKSITPAGYDRKPGLVDTVLKTGKFLAKRKLNDGARDLREFQYRLRSRIESRYFSKILEPQYCENLGRLLDEISKLLRNMSTQDYPPEYLSQIEAAVSSCKGAVEENLRMKSFLRSRSLPKARRKGGKSKLVKLEESVRILAVHLGGLAANI